MSTVDCYNWQIGSDVLILGSDVLTLGLSSVLNK